MTNPKTEIRKKIEQILEIKGDAYIRKSRTTKHRAKYRVAFFSGYSSEEKIKEIKQLPDVAGVESCRYHNRKGVAVYFKKKPSEIKLR